MFPQGYQVRIQSEYQYISQDKLRELLNSSDPTIVIDVRDEDFYEPLGDGWYAEDKLGSKGGKIKGACNIPSEVFLDKMDKINQQIESQTHKAKVHLVFHCMLSQQRGPKCARNYLRYLFEFNDQPTEKPLKNIEICVHVLEGGFSAWYKRFSQSSSSITDMIEYNE